MATEFSKIISDINQVEKSARRGRKPAHGERQGGARKTPEYENIADWKVIESALESVRLDQATPAGAETPWFADFGPYGSSAEAGSLPYGSTGRAGDSGGHADSMSQAISSAMDALRPQLLKMAKKEIGHIKGEGAASAETLSNYRAQFNGLIAQYQRHNGARDAENIEWVRFANWFIARQTDLSSSTWQTYRAALTSQLERIPSDDAIAALSLVQSANDSAAGKIYSESLRVKFISPDDYDRILFYCARNPSRSSAYLANYLRANVRIGLRPTEYLTSEVRIIPDKNAPNERQAWLFVCNAKYSSVRANGPIRLLDLSAMNDKAIAVIRDCIDEAKMQSHIVGYEQWISAINNTLQRVVKSPRSAVKTRYTAYSARHQAIANWKTMYDPISVAALAGHAMPSTAIQHYGSAKDGWSKERLKNMIARPCLADVERIHARALLARRMRSTAAGGGLAPRDGEEYDDLAPGA